MQNGALKLKKYKEFIRTALFSAFLISLTGFFGCKSLPLENPVSVNALDLLDNESAFYIAIPNDVDPDLIVRFLQNNIKDMSESDAKMISGRIDNVYCGLTHKKKKTLIQISSEAKIGNGLAKKIFNEKNGWQENLAITTFRNTYDVYERNVIELSFPSDSIALIGRDIPVMLDHYDRIVALEKELEGVGEIESCHLLDDTIYDYMSGAQDAGEIRFYAGRPQSFLTLLTGAQLDLKLDHVSGAFVCDSEHPNQYILSLDFKFKNETFLKAGRGLLTLAFGLTNSDCEMIGEDELRIYNIKIAKNSLYKILIL